MTTLSQVKAVQPDWFSRKNRKFFGDISYRILQGKRSKRPFLVRYTNQWSDMFGRPKQANYRVNELKADLTIGRLLDEQFRTIQDVKFWLQFN